MDDVRDLRRATPPRSLRTCAAFSVRPRKNDFELPSLCRTRKVTRPSAANMIELCGGVYPLVAERRCRSRAAAPTRLADPRTDRASAPPPSSSSNRAAVLRRPTACSGSTRGRPWFILAIVKWRFELQPTLTGTLLEPQGPLRPEDFQRSVRGWRRIRRHLGTASVRETATRRMSSTDFSARRSIRAEPSSSSTVARAASSARHAISATAKSGTR